MGKKLFVGNLPFAASDENLVSIFSNAGKVESARVVSDRNSGRSKGFGFVEMSTDAEAADALAKFNGADWEGRKMTVSEAKAEAPKAEGAKRERPRKPRPPKSGAPKASPTGELPKPVMTAAKPETSTSTAETPDKS